VRRVLLLIVMISLVSMAGCGHDPNSWRLRAGDEVMAAPPDPKETDITFTSDQATGGLGISTVNAGCKLRVVSDEEPDDPKLGHRSAYRDVTVYVLEGAEKGATGTVARKNIKPLR
jgi:hypothetical protein